MKFGVLMPSDTKDAGKIELEKELKNVKVAFQLLESDGSLPVGSTKIPIILSLTSNLTSQEKQG